MLGIRSDRWIVFFAAAALAGLLLPLAPAPAAMMRIPASVLFVAGFAGVAVAGAYAWQFDVEARESLEAARIRVHAWATRLARAPLSARIAARLRGVDRAIRRGVAPRAVRGLASR